MRAKRRLQERPKSERKSRSSGPKPIAVLAMDIVSYSKEYDEAQVRLVSVLNDLVLAALKSTASSNHVLLPTGDGAIIALPGRTSSFALDLAIHIHHAIKARLLRFSIRMGIHEGQGLIIPDVNGRDNVAGNVMNLAQRVMDVGDAEHILLSESAYLTLRNSKPRAQHIHSLKPNPVEVKHGLKLLLYNYYDGDIGNPQTPSKVIQNVGLSAVSIGRPAPWDQYVDTSKLLKVVGHCLRLLGSPDFQTKMEDLVVKRGTKIQILLLNSLSAAQDLRKYSRAYSSDSELDATFDYIFKSMKDFGARLKRQHEAADFDVRLFDAVPTFAGFITDDRAFISIYMEHSLGSMGPFFSCGRLEGVTALYDAVNSAFDSLWDFRSVSIFDRNFARLQADLLTMRREVANALELPDYQQKMRPAVATVKRKRSSSKTVGV